MIAAGAAQPLGPFALDEVSLDVLLGAKRRLNYVVVIEAHTVHLC